MSKTFYDIESITFRPQEGSAEAHADIKLKGFDMTRRFYLRGSIGYALLCALEDLEQARKEATAKWLEKYPRGILAEGSATANQKSADEVPEVPGYFDQGSWASKGLRQPQ